MIISNLLNNRYVLYIYYFIFTISLLIYSLYKPYYNWDMICYAASAKGFEISDQKELHDYVYTELKKSVPKDNYALLVKGDFYREIMFKDIEAFTQQLPFYQPRVLYSSLIFLLSKTGLNIFKATYLISSFAVFIGIWIIFFTLKLCLNNLNLIALSIVGLALGLLDLARYSTPDGLSFLIVFIIIVFLIKNHWGIFIVLPLSILIRTDLLIFASIILVYTFFYCKRQKNWQLFSIISFLICLLTYFYINLYYGNYGWSTIFYFTFIEKLIYPARTTVQITFFDYFKVLSQGTKNLLKNKSFLVYIIIMIYSTVQIIKNHKAYYQGIKNLEKIYFILILSALYVLFHFLLFPEIWQRFFVGQYMLGLICFLFLSSKRPSYFKPSDQNNLIKGLF